MRIKYSYVFANELEALTYAQSEEHRYAFVYGTSTRVWRDPEQKPDTQWRVDVSRQNSCD